jgi:hypothetical protein
MLLRGRNSHLGGRWLNNLHGEALRQVDGEPFPRSDTVNNRRIFGANLCKRIQCGATISLWQFFG